MTARGDIEKLAFKVRAALERKGLSHASLAALADVDPSQISRISRGQFRRISENVMRVCKELGIEVAGGPVVQDDPLARYLQAEVLKVWDKTPAGAERLTRLLREISAFTGRSAAKPK